MCIRELEQQFTFMSHIYSITFILYILTTHYKHTLIIRHRKMFRCKHDFLQKM